MVSQADAQGRVVVVEALADVQGAHFPGPVVLVARNVGGMEDIPVSAVPLPGRGAAESCCS